MASNKATHFLDFTLEKSQSWLNFRRKLDSGQFERRMFKVMQNALRKIAMDIKRDIQLQVTNVAPLHPSTLADRRKREGFSGTRPYMTKSDSLAANIFLSQKRANPKAIENNPIEIRVKDTVNARGVPYSVIFNILQNGQVRNFTHTKASIAYLRWRDGSDQWSWASVGKSYQIVIPPRPIVPPAVENYPIEDKMVEYTRGMFTGLF